MPFNFTHRYIDDVLFINNSRFVEFLPLIYPPELEVKETTDTASSASFLDLYLSPGPVACFSDEDDVSGNQNNCYWHLHSESIARCKHHMQEKLVYCCTCLSKNTSSEQYQNQINGEQIDTLNTHIGSRLLSDTASSASFLDLYLEFDDSGQLSTKIYE
jgi:hypothetical protein